LKKKLQGGIRSGGGLKRGVKKKEGVENDLEKRLGDCRGGKRTEEETLSTSSFEGRE